MVSIAYARIGDRHKYYCLLASEHLAIQYAIIRAWNRIHELVCNWVFLLAGLDSVERRWAKAAKRATA